jgi:tetratricopeptide (TPR) repeat protein
VELLKQTAISVPWIEKRIVSAGVGQVMVVVDACRNDPTGGRSGGDNQLTPSFVRGFDFAEANNGIRAFATLFATTVGQRAYESSSKRQGVFMYTLVEGLSGAAANERGEVTLLRLKQYLERRVPELVLTEVGPGREQRPWANIAGYRSEDLVVAFVARPKKAPSEDDQLFWNSVKDSRSAAEYAEYLKRFPEGIYSGLARVRINELPKPNTSAKGNDSGAKPTAATSPGTVPVAPPTTTSKPPSATPPADSSAATTKTNPQPAPEVNKRPAEKSPEPTPSNRLKPEPKPSAPAVTLLLEKAIDASNADDTKTARGLVAQVFAVDANNVRATYLLATLEYRDGRREKTEALVERVLKQDPTYDDAQVLRALLRLDVGDLVPARSDLEQVLARDANHGFATFLRGDIALLEEGRKRASEYYARALEILPTSSRYYAFASERLTAARGCALDEGSQVIRVQTHGFKCPPLAKATRSRGEIITVVLVSTDGNARAVLVRKGLKGMITEYVRSDLFYGTYEVSTCGGSPVPRFAEFVTNVDCRE